MASKFIIETSRKPKAVKFVFYGPEGIGKSTLASMLPWPIFIDTEGSTDHMNVPRYPRPRSWDSLLEMVDDAAQMGGIKTLIIDTADWAERLCAESLCAAKGWKGIEDAGYGKGYVYLREKFGQLLKTRKNTYFDTIKGDCQTGNPERNLAVVSMDQICYGSLSPFNYMEASLIDMEYGCYDTEAMKTNAARAFKALR